MKISAGQIEIDKFPGWYSAKVRAMLNGNPYDFMITPIRPDQFAVILGHKDGETMKGVPTHFIDQPETGKLRVWPIPDKDYEVTTR